MTYTPFTDTEGLRSYRPSVWEAKPIGWLTRWLEAWRGWRQDR